MRLLRTEPTRGRRKRIGEEKEEEKAKEKEKEEEKEKEKEKKGRTMSPSTIHT